jgi:hypothetical protein
VSFTGRLSFTLIFFESSIAQPSVTIKKDMVNLSYKVESYGFILTDSFSYLAQHCLFLSNAFISQMLVLVNDTNDIVNNLKCR